MSKLLIVKTGSAPPAVAAEHGDFEHWFLNGLDLTAEDVRVVDVQSGEDLPLRPAELAGVLVTGSPAMVSHREDWSERTAAWLVESHRASVPMLGVCYGHQLIAHALGGTVGPNPAGRRMGTKVVRIRSDPDGLLAGLEADSDLHVTHVEAVLKLPAGARIVADTHGDPHHALHFGQRSWGVQFHPEFSARIMASYIHLRATELLDEGHCPDTLLGELKDSPDGARVLRGFTERLERSAPVPDREPILTT